MNKKPPECVCGKISNGHKKNGQSICNSCYLKTYKTPLVVCSNCKQIKNIFTRNPIILCYGCYMEKYEAPLKNCVICKEIKAVHKNTKNGPICKKCYKETYKPPKKICSKCRKMKPIAYKKDMLCLNCRNKDRMINDEQFFIRSRIRKRISKIFKRNGISKTFSINFDEIVKQLGSCPGKRQDYHIDHILPLVAFDLTNENHVRAALAPENHQWLKISENCSKKDVYNEEIFLNYIKKFS